LAADVKKAGGDMSRIANQFVAALEAIAKLKI
jgi:hypothetical protein